MRGTFEFDQPFKRQKAKRQNKQERFQAVRLTCVSLGMLRRFILNKQKKRGWPTLLFANLTNRTLGIPEH